MVSHGAPLMEQMCDEVAWLDHGRLMAKGDPSEVVRKYLEKVNVVENERLSNTAEVPVVDNDEIVVDTAVRRAGSREIEITRLRVPRRIRRTDTVRQHRRPADRSAFGTAAVRPSTEPVFGLGFNTDSGVRCRGSEHVVRRGSRRVPSTAKATSTSSSTGWRSCRGTWRLSVAIVDDKMLHTYDHLEEGYEFHVQPGSSVERYGIADLQGRWRVNE